MYSVKVKHLSCNLKCIYDFVYIELKSIRNFICLKWKLVSLKLETYNTNLPTSILLKYSFPGTIVPRSNYSLGKFFTEKLFDCRNSSRGEFLQGQFFTGTILQRDTYSTLIQRYSFPK